MDHASNGHNAIKSNGDRSDTSPVNVDSHANKSSRYSFGLARLGSAIKSKTASFDIFGSQNPPSTSNTVSVVKPIAETVKSSPVPQSIGPSATRRSQDTASKRPAQNESKDIFSSSLSEIIIEIGKDTLGLIKKPSSSKPPSSQVQSTVLSKQSKSHAIPVDASPMLAVPNNETHNKIESIRHIPKNQSNISDILELDRDNIDSPQLSVYHVEQSKILNDDDDCSMTDMPSDPSYINGKQVICDRLANRIVFSKNEFMDSLTDLPDELLDEGHNYNSLSDLDTEAGDDCKGPPQATERFYLSYEVDDDCV